MNYDYPDGDYATRARDLARAPRLPAGPALLPAPTTRASPSTSARRSARGACARTSSPTPATGRTRSTSARPGGWSADYVMTQADCEHKTDRRGLGRHGRVQHGLAQHASAYVDRTGHVHNEGDVQVEPRRPVPDQLPRDRAEGRRVRRTCSSRCACRQSHIAYGSIRMEPVFMVLGQSAATAACDGDRRGDRPCRTWSIPSCGGNSWQPGKSWTTRLQSASHR